MSKLVQYKIALTSFIFLFFSLTVIAQVPVINSFTPSSGNIGSSVTISGSDFDATPANNIVFFGPVRANVSAASSTSLTVDVPAGAAYELIRVTVNGLSAYSSLPFNVTFTTANISSTSFPLGFSGPLNGFSDPNLITADFDGDGKADILISYRSDSVSILRNTSTVNMISFADRINFPIGNSIAAFGQAKAYSIADMDGDGKPDILVSDAHNKNISIFRNISTIGNISFETKIDFANITRPGALFTGDFDGDGKIDIVVANFYDSSVSVFRNISTISSIALEPKITYRTGVWPATVSITDLDGDLKPEIICTNDSSNTISIFKNLSSIGTISFDPRIDIAAGANPSFLLSMDLDGDQKMDLITTNRTSNTIAIFRNNSSGGNISFDTRIDEPITPPIIPAPPPFNQNSYPISLASGDLDGDGKPDLAVGCYTESMYASGFYKVVTNTSTAGNISFGNKIQLGQGLIQSILISDLDNNGKPEILVSSPNDYTTALLVFQNKVGDLVDVELCPPVGNTTLTSNLFGTSYQWQISTDSVTFTNISSNSNYSGSNLSALQLINIPSSQYGNLYRCIVDGNASDVFRIRFTNRWQGSGSTWESPSNWSCGDVPDANTDVYITFGNVYLNSDVTIRSLTISNGATLTVAPGHNLTILH